MDSRKMTVLTLQTSRLLAIAAIVGTGLMIEQTAHAQSYSYSYGNGRVTTESQSGLVHPSGSYIGPGTVSQSARGQYGAGAQVNPGLPRVSMGANVATPGDNMYGANPTRTTVPQQQQGGKYNSLPSGRMGANVGMPGDGIRTDLGRNSQLPPKQQFRWANPQQQMQMQQMAPQQTQGPQAVMTPNGTATYSDAEIKQGIHF